MGYAEDFGYDAYDSEDVQEYRNKAMSELTAYQKDVYAGKICPYCKTGTKLVSEEAIYGHKYKGRAIRACKNWPACDAYVGCDDNGIALGRLARQKLRGLKMDAHAVFDLLWKDGHMKRNKAYSALSRHLGIPREYTHIGWFNIETCREVIKWSVAKIAEVKSIKSKKL